MKFGSVFISLIVLASSASFATKTPARKTIPTENFFIENIKQNINVEKIMFEKRYIDYLQSLQPFMLIPSNSLSKFLLNLDMSREIKATVFALNAFPQSKPFTNDGFLQPEFLNTKIKFQDIKTLIAGYPGSSALHISTEETLVVASHILLAIGDEQITQRIFETSGFDPLIKTSLGDNMIHSFLLLNTHSVTQQKRVGFSHKQTEEYKKAFSILIDQAPASLLQQKNILGFTPLAFSVFLNKVDEFKSLFNKSTAKEIFNSYPLLLSQAALHDDKTIESYLNENKDRFFLTQKIALEPKTNLVSFNFHPLFLKLYGHLLLNLQTKSRVSSAMKSTSKAEFHLSFIDSILKQLQPDINKVLSIEIEQADTKGIRSQVIRVEVREAISKLQAVTQEFNDWLLKLNEQETSRKLWLHNIFAKSAVNGATDGMEMILKQDVEGLETLITALEVYLKGDQINEDKIQKAKKFFLEESIRSYFLEGVELFSRENSGVKNLFNRSGLAYDPVVLALLSFVLLEETNSNKEAAREILYRLSDQSGKNLKYVQFLGMDLVFWSIFFGSLDALKYFVEEKQLEVKPRYQMGEAVLDVQKYLTSERFLRMLNYLKSKVKFPADSACAGVFMH